MAKPKKRRKRMRKKSEKKASKKKLMVADMKTDIMEMKEVKVKTTWTFWKN